MQYALIGGDRALATPRSFGTCEACKEQVVAKCGRIVVWHWAHKVADCDPWYEPESAWHRNWKKVVPEAQREVVVGQHRADIRNARGTVIELQASALPVDAIRAREACYGRDMIWIWDVSKAGPERLEIRTKGRPWADGVYATFRWKHPRKSIAACRAAVFLDLDGEVDVEPKWLLKLDRMYPDAPCGGYGHLWSREKVERWVRDVY